MRLVPYYRLFDYESTLETAKSIVVFGSTKPPWDVVYAHASKDIKAEWVIKIQHKS